MEDQKTFIKVKQQRISRLSSGKMNAFLELQSLTPWNTMCVLDVFISLERERERGDRGVLGRGSGKERK